MKNNTCKKLFGYIALWTVLVFVSISLQSCTTYSTNFNNMEKFQTSSASDIKEGSTCSYNLFGGFSLPWIGDTAVRVNGDQSVITAIKKAGIRHIYSVDYSTIHYIFYSKRCTMVFGY